jgi:hypothetical protein
MHKRRSGFSVDATASGSNPPPPPDEDAAAALYTALHRILLLQQVGNAGRLSNAGADQDGMSDIPAGNRIFKTIQGAYYESRD